MSPGPRLGLIMLLSLLSVAYGLLERDLGGPEVVARVNGEAVTVQAVLDGAGDPPDPVTHAWVDAAMERAIVEALYFQRARELRLMEQDAVLRGRVLQLLREVAEEEAALAPVHEDAARALYAEDPARFSTRAVVRFEEVYVRATGSEAPDRLEEAHARLVGGEEVAAVHATYGDRPPFAFPEGDVPIHVVARRYGREVARTMLQTPLGRWSDPVRGASGFHVIRVIARDDPEPLAFEEVRASLEATLRERRRRLSVMTWTQRLRQEANVEAAPWGQAALMEAARR